MSLRALRSRIERLETRIPLPASSLTGDEAIRARVAELGSKWWGSAYPTNPITKADQKDIDYLKLHYPQYAPEDPFAEVMEAIEKAARGDSTEEECEESERYIEELINKCFS
jgi:hypothetical protein